MRPTEMLRIVGVGISSERVQLINKLTKLGCVELSKCGDIEGTIPSSHSEGVDNANIKLARLQFARAFIKEQKGVLARLAKKKVKYFTYSVTDEGLNRIKTLDESEKVVKLKKPLIERRPEIDYDEFITSDHREGEIFDLIAKLEGYNQELLTIKSEEVKSMTLIKQVAPYYKFGLEMSKYTDTKTCAVRLGRVKAKKFQLLRENLDSVPSVTLEVMSDTENKKIKEYVVVVIAFKEYATTIDELLEKAEFIKLESANRVTAKMIVEGEKANLRVARERRRDIAKAVKAEFDTLEYIAKSRLLEDFYNVKLQMFDALHSTRETDKAYVFEGWVPSNCQEEVSKKLDESDMSLGYIIREAEDGEMRPTMLEDNGLVTPFQSVTNMYTPPMYNEINPNPFVMFFFVLFFGVMISDAGYGVLTSIATAIILLKAKPRRNEMSMVKILFLGGLSTIFWGIMFGGYFGIDFGDTKVAIMFNPIDSPLNMLFLSVGLGLCQMLTGMAINAYALFRQHKPWDAIFGVGSWFVLVLGGGLIFIKQVPNIAAFIIVGVGIVGLMIGGALHKKGARMIGGAFGKLYGLINFFSDLMSYTRLFGLGLATSVIAMVFNQLAGIMIGISPVVGYIVAPFILVVGHSFNIFINTLGAYVHNSRLQFVEFFGRFYTGGGQLFRPLGSSRKYYNFTVEEVTKS